MTGEVNHDPISRIVLARTLAGFDPFKGVFAAGQGQSLWFDEKKNYHGQPIPFTIEELSPYSTLVITFRWLGRRRARLVLQQLVVVMVIHLTF